MQSLSQSQQVSILFFVFVEIYKLILKFTREQKGPRIVKTLLEKKKRVGWLTLLNFKTYYIATVIKTVILVARQTHGSVE